jgi:hypothetical protein
LFFPPKGTAIAALEAEKERWYLMFAFVEAFVLIALMVGGLFAVGSTCAIVFARAISALEARRIRMRPAVVVVRPARYVALGPRARV